jgi:hypothetical protein
MPYYTIGIDPGQAHDPTALALLEHDRVQEPVYRLRGLHRFPLGTPYTKLAPALNTRLSSPPLAGNTKIAIDATGVGTPVLDHLRDQLPTRNIYGITITAGSSLSGTPKDPHVPKKDLIATTIVILEQRRLQIAEPMHDTNALIEELLAYRRITTDHGHDTYQAASGTHDDLVLALSLALWTAEHKPLPPRRYTSSWQQLRDMRIPGADLPLWNWDPGSY